MFNLLGRIWMDIAIWLYVLSSVCATIEGSQKRSQISDMQESR